MESINIKALNELLQKSTRQKYFLNKTNGHHGVPDNSDGEQGEYNEVLSYYRHPEMPENVFLQISEHTDSYGDNLTISEMKFVQGVAKQVTVYEPIK